MRLPRIRLRPCRRCHPYPSSITQHVRHMPRITLHRRQKTTVLAFSPLARAIPCVLAAVEVGRGSVQRARLTRAVAGTMISFYDWQLNTAGVAVASTQWLLATTAKATATVRICRTLCLLTASDVAAFRWLKAATTHHHATDKWKYSRRRKSTCWQMCLHNRQSSPTSQFLSALSSRRVSLLLSYPRGPRTR